MAPAFSALVLNSGEYSDGLLQAREIIQYNSDLSLLVLASCSSAKGGLAGRYGSQLGLADAFVQSGVQAVIGTLWDVQDLKTAQFMKWFYQSLSHVQMPSIALHETKLKARNAGWSVGDWSGFVMLGDNATALKMEPIKPYDIMNRIMLWLTLLLLTVVLVKFLLGLIK